MRSRDDHPHELISAFLDGEIDARERNEVEAHLRACAQCRALAGDLRTLDLAIAAEAAPAIPATLASRIAWRLRSVESRAVDVRNAIDGDSAIGGDSAIDGESSIDRDGSIGRDSSTGGRNSIEGEIRPSRVSHLLSRSTFAVAGAAAAAAALVFVLVREQGPDAPRIDGAAPTISDGGAAAQPEQPLRADLPESDGDGAVRDSLLGANATTARENNERARAARTPAEDLSALDKRLLRAEAKTGRSALSAGKLESGSPPPVDGSEPRGQPPTFREQPKRVAARGAIEQNLPSAQGEGVRGASEAGSSPAKDLDDFAPAPPSTPPPDSLDNPPPLARDKIAAVGAPAGRSFQDRKTLSVSGAVPLVTGYFYEVGRVVDLAAFPAIVTATDPVSIQREIAIRAGIPARHVALRNRIVLIHGATPSGGETRAYMSKRQGFILRVETPEDAAVRMRVCTLTTSAAPHLVADARLAGGGSIAGGDLLIADGDRLIAGALRAGVKGDRNTGIDAVAQSADDQVASGDEGTSKGAFGKDEPSEDAEAKPEPGSAAADSHGDRRVEDRRKGGHSHQTGDEGQVAERRAANDRFAQNEAAGTSSRLRADARLAVAERFPPSGKTLLVPAILNGRRAVLAFHTRLVPAREIGKAPSLDTSGSSNLGLIAGVESPSFDLEEITTADQCE